MRGGHRRPIVMSYLDILGAIVLVLAMLCGIRSLSALPLTPFRYEGQAQRHCPDDEVVWLDFVAGRYYTKGQKRHGRGPNGSFVCRNEAKASGFRRSLLGIR